MGPPGVGRMLLATEGVDLSVEEAASVIVDIDKCYENVQHTKLVRAAVQHGFPLRILRMCLMMYRASRTVAWDGVYGGFVQTCQTIVAGCSIALWLLQLVMLTPLDEFVCDIPWQVKCPEVYVDDTTLTIVGRGVRSPGSLRPPPEY